MSYKEYLNQLEYKSNYIFKDDKVEDIVYSKGRQLKLSERHLIHNKLRPQPFVGDLKKGKIFIFLLNPGFHDEDYKDEIVIKEELNHQLKQENASFFWLKKEFEHTNGGRYWRSLMNQKDPEKSLVQNIKEKYNDNGFEYTDNDIFHMLSMIMVNMELFPYHSKSASSIRYHFDLYKENCRSVREVYNFVHNELIPNAKKNNQLVCFVRAIDLWGGWDEQDKENVKCIKFGRARPYFNVHNELGSAVLKHIDKLTNHFTRNIEQVINEK